MVLRVDPDSPQAQLLSLPRDLYLDIPGAGERRSTRRWRSAARKP